MDFSVIDNLDSTEIKNLFEIEILNDSDKNETAACNCTVNGTYRYVYFCPLLYASFNRFGGDWCLELCKQMGNNASVFYGNGPVDLHCYCAHYKTYGSRPDCPM